MAFAQTSNSAGTTTSCSLSGSFSGVPLQEASLVFRIIICPLVLLLFLCAGSLRAQSAPPTSDPQSQTRPTQRGGPPCWQQAGIEKSVMEQRWSIERDTRSQIQGVCSDSSLTPQQKHQQVHEIREQARQKMEGLITADQQNALTACQQSRHRTHPGGVHGGVGDGCGDLPRGGPRPSPNGGTGRGYGNNNAPSVNPPSPQN